jgi:hypothetical protein
VMAAQSAAEREREAPDIEKRLLELLARHD